MDTVEQNKAILNRFVEEFWNQKNFEVLNEIYAEDAYSPSAPQLPPGIEGMSTVGKMIFTAFPDFHMSIEKVVAEGDKVVGKFSESGTHLGEFFGIPPTGKSATWGEIGILQIRDGKIAVSWFCTDMLGMMTQLGVGGGGPPSE